MQPPVISCSGNLVRGTDPNQCTAVVNYTTTATDNCPLPAGAVVCNPPTGTAFPRGVTMVNCTATDGSGNQASCSFSVTVNDTQAPVIVCPANIVAVTPVMGGTGVVVTYPDPVVTDNCPLGANPFVCSPPSGSTFPVGTTTVTCTGTDASGNMSMCSFVVTTFDICLEDDTDATRVLLFNSNTGDYVFCCNGQRLTGKGRIKKKGGEITLEHNNGNRRVMGKVTGFLKKGHASLKSPPGAPACTITDSNIDNNACNCLAPAP
jgi:hypothetical protein